MPSRPANRARAAWGPREHGGAVVSVTIDKYVYLTLQTKFDHHPNWLFAH